MVLQSSSSALCERESVEERSSPTDTHTNPFLFTCFFEFTLLYPFHPNFLPLQCRSRGGDLSAMTPCGNFRWLTGSYCYTGSYSPLQIDGNYGHMISFQLKLGPQPAVLSPALITFSAFKEKGSLSLSLLSHFTALEDQTTRVDWIQPTGGFLCSTTSILVSSPLTYSFRTLLPWLSYSNQICCALLESYLQSPCRQALVSSLSWMGMVLELDF